MNVESKPLITLLIIPIKHKLPLAYYYYIFVT